MEHRENSSESSQNRVELSRTEVVHAHLHVLVGVEYEQILRLGDLLLERVKVLKVQTRSQFSSGSAQKLFVSSYSSLFKKNVYV